MTETMPAGKVAPGRWRASAPTAALVALCMTVAPLAGCERDASRGANAPPIDESMRYPGAPATPAAPKPAESHTMRNIIVLGGAAALYYMYKKQQKQGAQTGEPQYYLSKTGRVYYRDAGHRAHWVTPPAEGIRVPAAEAEQFREFQGYDNRATGRDLRNLPEALGEVQ